MALKLRVASHRRGLSRQVRLRIDCTTYGILTRSDYIQNRKLTCTSILGDNSEHAWFMSDAMAEARSVRCHVTRVDVVHMELKVRVCDGGVVEYHGGYKLSYCSFIHTFMSSQKLITYIYICDLICLLQNQ